MNPRRIGSRVKFSDYNRKRREDPEWSKSKLDDQGGAKKVGKRSRSALSLIREFMKFIRLHRWAVVLALGTLTITTGISLVLPASTKLVVDYVLTDHPGPSGLPGWVRSMVDGLPWVQASDERSERYGMLWVIGAAMVVLSVFAVMIGIVGRWQMTRVTKRVQAQMRSNAFEHASRLPLVRIQHYKSGGMSSLLREDAGSAGELLFSMVYNPWRAIVQLVGTMIVLAFVDWRLLAGALLLIPVMWVTQRTWIGRIRPLFRDSKAARMKIDATTTEVFGGMRIVRGFSRERSESVSFSLGQHYFTRIEVLTWWWSRIIETAWAVLIPAASAGIMIYGGTQVIRGALSIGDLMMFTTYVLMLLGPLETLTSTATNVQNNLAAMDRVLDLLDEPEEFEDGDGGPKMRLTRDRVAGRVELSHVWFAYPKAAQGGKPAGAVGGDAGGGGGAAKVEPTFVLQDVSLVAEPGQTIALVGASGAGKTTLCNLVARFYDTTKGSVSLDGRDLRELDVRSYRSLLGIVEQDVFLFDGSVAENIGYGRRDATMNDVQRAARAANAHEFILALEKGYDTLIGERGVRLSGGQKQRLAIARALLADPKILILDEATSNLDTESERLIQQSLGVLMKGRTCFVIAHRLSTVRNADRIVVIEGGKVVESGTHEELIAKTGRYAWLLRLQVEGHKAGEASDWDKELSGAG